MGINGLLPLLKSIQKPCHLKKFAGQTIGVDAYGWLHRGTVACAIELALGKPTRKHIDFSMHRVRMLLHFGVIPYIVFDGDYLPSKANIEVERAKRREESKQKGLELYRLNKPSQAHLEFQKAVDVTPEMARQLIEELKKIGVQYIVAPYEADAQLVYLERKGIIQGMISEDSDLLVFGAKSLLTKLDQYGECVEFNRADFTSCREVNLTGWTDAEFRRMAILSGCDYLANINKMGLKTAYRFVRKYKTIEKIIRMMQFDGRYHVPTGYLEAYYKAEMTFLYQRVFCPTQDQITTISELQDGLDPDSLPFIGDTMEQAVAVGVARGDLDPMTKAPIIVSKPCTNDSPKTPWARPFNETKNFPSSKENKSIDQFFKSARTPLAELDPNSFTPSPTQQRLLQRSRNSSWSSTPTQNETVTHSSRTPVLGYDSAQGISRRLMDIEENAPMSRLGSSRKRRYEPATSPVGFLQDSEETEGTCSKFFATGAAGSKRRGNKSRKRPTDFTVWSDDSTEDAMVELANSVAPPDFGGSHHVEAEEAHDPKRQQPGKPLSRESSLQEDSHSSVSSKDTMESQLSESTLATTVSSSEASLAKTLDRHVTAELSELTEKCLFKEEAPQNPQLLSKETIESEKDTISPQKPCVQRLSDPSGLRKFGTSILNRSKSSATLSDSVGRPSSSVLLSKHHSEAARTLRRVGSTPSLPLNHSIGPDASRFKGSEDALVPNSEDEEVVSDSVTEVEDTPPKKAAINLGHFAFNG